MDQIWIDVVEQEEFWIELHEWPGYELSNHGRVKSTRRWIVDRLKSYWLPEKILIISFKPYGHIVFRREGKSFTKRVHRLVAKAFIPNPDNLPQVNHKDGNKQNNHVDNLEWCTSSGNMYHSYGIGLRTSPLAGKKSKNAFQRKRVYQYNRKIQQLCEYVSATEAAKITGYKMKTIAAAAAKKSSAHNFIWSYEPLL